MQSQAAEERRADVSWIKSLSSNYSRMTWKRCSVLTVYPKCMNSKIQACCHDSELLMRDANKLCCVLKCSCPCFGALFIQETKSKDISYLICLMSLMHQ